MKQIEEKTQYFFTLKFHAVNSTNTYWGKKDNCKLLIKTESVIYNTRDKNKHEDKDYDHHE